MKALTILQNAYNDLLEASKTDGNAAIARRDIYLAMEELKEQQAILKGLIDYLEVPENYEPSHLEWLGERVHNLNESDLDRYKRKHKEYDDYVSKLHSK